MEGDVQQLIDQTGVSVPLAAQLFKVIADSGASQLEITVALNLVGHLRHLLDSSLIPGR